VSRSEAAEELNNTPERDAHRLRNGIIWSVGLALLLLAIGLAVPDLRGVLDRASHARLGWLALGVVLELVSCLGYVATMRLVLPRGPPAGSARRRGSAARAAQRKRPRGLAVRRRSDAPAGTSGRHRHGGVQQTQQRVWSLLLPPCYPDNRR